MTINGATETPAIQNKLMIGEGWRLGQNGSFIFSGYELDYCFRFEKGNSGHSYHG